MKIQAAVTFEVFNQGVPSWAIAPLINGDETGLDADESHALQEFVADWKNEARSRGASSWHIVTPDVEEQPSFTATNDLPGIMGREGSETQTLHVVMVWRAA
jgi:hypothetical protein